jgi:hypothetical protein
MLSNDSKADRNIFRRDKRSARNNAHQTETERGYSELTCLFTIAGIQPLVSILTLKALRTAK